MAMLEVRDLEVSYGLIRAIRGVSFAVNEGEIVALIGANGAGKTTIMHAVAGLIPKRAGQVSFLGNDITNIQIGSDGDGASARGAADFSGADG